MKIKVNDELFFELSETQKKVIKNDIHADEFDEDIKRRLSWVIDHKYQNCLKRMKDEWLQKLKEAGIESIPLNDEKFAELVFKQPDYKDRATRDKEDEEQRKKVKEI